MKRITIEDVAQAAGVSRQTVSRAINDKAEISQETRDRVMQAVQALGYRPNRLAQSMVTQRTFTVGLVVGNITNPFFPEVTRGVQDVAQANDYNVFLCNTDDNPELEMQILHSLAAQGVDGIILFPNVFNDQVLRDFVDSYRPLVVINRVFDHPNVSVVMVDNYRGAQLAVDYFVDHQHTRIGMLTADIPSHSQVRRVEGFKSQIIARGLLAADSHIIRAPATLKGGFQAAQQLLTDHPDITAIFTYNDLMACGAIRACREMGRSIPDDVALIGFDNISFASMVTPSLSTIDVDKYNIGRVAMTRLLAMMKAPEETFPHIKLGVKLLLRESA